MKEKITITFLKAAICQLYIDNIDKDNFFKLSMDLIHSIYKKDHINYWEAKNLELFTANLYKIEKKGNVCFKG